jgi:hypothetical protein
MHHIPYLTTEQHLCPDQAYFLLLQDIIQAIIAVILIYQPSDQTADRKA